MSYRARQGRRDHRPRARHPARRRRGRAVRLRARPRAVALGAGRHLPLPDAAAVRAGADDRRDGGRAAATPTGSAGRPRDVLAPGAAAWSPTPARRAASSAARPASTRCTHEHASRRRAGGDARPPAGSIEALRVAGPAPDRGRDPLHRQRHRPAADLPRRARGRRSSRASVSGCWTTSGRSATRRSSQAVTAVDVPEADGAVHQLHQRADLRHHRPARARGWASRCSPPTRSPCGRRCGTIGSPMMAAGQWLSAESTKPTPPDR